MNCEKARELISPYIDDELEDIIATELSEHLLTCSDCSELYTKTLKLSETLKLSKDVEPSTDFRTKLMTSLLQQERESTILHVITSMKVGWIIGASSTLQAKASSDKVKKAFSYADYINRDKPQHVVCYDVSRSKYVELENK